MACRGKGNHSHHNPKLLRNCNRGSITRVIPPVLSPVLSLFCAGPQFPLPGPLFIVRSAQVAKRGPMGEQVIDDAREFVGGGDDGRLGTEAGPHAPVEGPQAIVAATRPLAPPAGRLGRRDCGS